MPPKTAWLILVASVLTLLANAAATQAGAAGGARLRFVLMIDGQPAARFTSAHGLQPAKSGWITLTHGSSLNTDLLDAWCHAGSGKKSPATVILLMLGENNNLLGRYQLVHARPKAGGNSGSLEELMIHHEGLQKLN
jgi:hypothetical protein